MSLLLHNMTSGPQRYHWSEANIYPQLVHLSLCVPGQLDPCLHASLLSHMMACNIHLLPQAGSHVLFMLHMEEASGMIHEIV